MINYIKQQDFKIARDYAILYLRPHITLETLFFQLLSRSDIISTMNIVFPYCDIEKLRDDIKNCMEDTEPYVVDNPEPNFHLEYITKLATSISLLSDKKELMFTDMMLALLSEADNDIPIIEIFNNNNIVPDLNTTITLMNWNTEMNMDPNNNNNNPGVSKKEINMHEFNAHTELLNDTVKENTNFIPSVGCDDRLEELQRTLLRTYKSSIIVTGNAGVGKSNLVETFTDLINKEQVHDDLSNLKIYSLSVSSLLSDIKFHGVLEARVNAIIQVLEANPDFVLFIDEIHMLYSAGGAGSNNDVMNLLKVPLAKNKIKIIGATTINEYDKFISKNAGFQRRFTNIVLDEPTNDETFYILQQRKEGFENHYKISISDDCLWKIVELTGSYIKSRFNPDKSVDILDSIFARKKLFSGKEITISDVYTEVSKACRIPTDEITKSKADLLNQMTNTLKSKIVGQDKAFDNLSDILSVSMSGLRDSESTMGNFLFQGPTSCGKTETAKIIAKELGIPLIRYDMSAYKEKHTVATLLGSPPGYIGYNDGAVGGGKLISDITNNPHCVLLLDEVEKAHPDVLTILLQIMDYGKITSSSGQDAYFSKVILIMTSNLGSKESEKPSIGFGNQSVNNNTENVNEFIKDFLAPEFRARLDTIIRFNKLKLSDMVEITNNKLVDFTKELEKHNLSIEIDSDVVNKIAQDSFDSNLGARNIQNVISNDIKSKVAKYILSNTTSNTKKQVQKRLVKVNNSIDLT